MKTILRNTKLVMILAFLPALLSAAQAQAVNYKNKYQPSSVSYQFSADSYQGATTPTATFQSTSAYSDSFEEQSQPMLNADGTVNAEAYGVGQNNAPGRHIRTATPNPDVDPNDPGNVPLGDGLMALMLCACAYLIVRATRKEEKIG